MSQPKVQQSDGVAVSVGTFGTVGTFGWTAQEQESQRTRRRPAGRVANEAQSGSIEGALRHPSVRGRLQAGVDAGHWQAARGCHNSGFLNKLQHKALLAEIVATTQTRSGDISDDKPARHLGGAGGGSYQYRGGGGGGGGGQGGLIGGMMGGLFGWR
jgi:hypothetical protein